MGNKHWTPEEDEYLREHWGKASLNAIAKNLGRTENALLCRKGKLHLGAFLDNHPKGAVTLGAVCTALKVRYHNYIMTSWVEQRELPIFTKKVRNCKFRFVIQRPALCTYQYYTTYFPKKQQPHSESDE